VSYRDVPGIDHAYLAMDTEEGVEVVWNEAMFSETKRFKVCPLFIWILVQIICNLIIKNI
jgi:hypothetical protein